MGGKGYPVVREESPDGGGEGCGGRGVRGYPVVRKRVMMGEGRGVEEGREGWEKIASGGGRES